MKKIIIFAFYFLAGLSLFKFTEAAPAPWGLAINTETKECAGFWPGDEFVAYDLPEGWKAYYPNYSAESNWGKIQTDAGECSFQIHKEEACCMELGYKYVSDNIGKGQKTILRNREAFEKQLEQHRKYGKYSNFIPLLLPGGVVFAILIVLAGIIALDVWLKRRKKNRSNE